MQTDTGNDFVMINLIDLHDEPQRLPGSQSKISANEALDRYMDYMYPALFIRASHPVLFGNASGTAIEVIGARGMESWTLSGAVRYRSRRDLVRIITHPSFSGHHDFKELAMSKTIAVPLEPWFQAGDPRLLLGMFLLLVASLAGGLAGIRGRRR